MFYSQIDLLCYIARNIKITTMKKVLLLTSLGLITSLSNAQITLTMQNATPQVGDNFAFKQISNPSIGSLETQNGPNQTWDYSSVSGTSIPDEVLDFVSPSTLNNNSYFPSATCGTSGASVQGNAAENYYKTSADGFELKGATISANGNLSVTVNDEGMYLLKYPMTYLTSYTDSLKASSYSVAMGQTGDPLPRKGVSTITGDGYGDLILPYGTVHNVLRVKVEREYADYIFGNPSFTNIETSYYYYTDYGNFMIAARTKLTINGMSAADAFIYRSQSTFPNLSADLFTPAAKTTIYPNPANSTISFSDLPEHTFVQIMNIQGKVVKSIDMSTQKSIDISTLESGIYFAKLESLKENETIKFVKQ